jgi:hypothetical protein
MSFTSRLRKLRSHGSRSCGPAALERQLEADVALGKHAELVGELEELVSAQPLPERVLRQLMLADSLLQLA